MKDWFADTKARILLAAFITGTFGPLLLAWNGTSSWHVAIGVAAAADITSFTTWLVPNSKPSA